MSRLIDADRLIELIDDDIASLDKNMSREGYDVCLCTLQMVKQYIKALPAVEPIKNGWWVFDDENGGYRCSVCKTLGGKSSYCPNCGARMLVEVEE